MILGFTYQFITLVLSFLSRTVFIKTLGVEYLGLNGTFADVLNLLSMADLGFNITMSYSFYKPLAEHNEKRLTALICFYKKIYNVIACSVVSIGLLIIPFLRFIINTEKEIPHLILYYSFSLAGIVISYLFVYRTTILTADQKNHEVLKISIWTTLIKVLLQIGSLLLWENYILYLTIGVTLQLTNNLLASKKAERMYPYIKNKENISRNEEKKIFANMRSVFLYKISGTMFSATGNVLISIIIGTGMVGIYSNYIMVSSKLLLIIQIIFSALTASIGNVIVMEGVKKRFEVFDTLQSVSFIFCGIITSVFCIMANDLVFVWLGGEFTIPTSAIWAMTLNTYLSCVLQPLWTYRDATGLYMRTKYIMLLGALLNIVLSIIMGKIWGLTGIILASSVSKLSTYFWYEPKILFKEYFERKVKKYYFSIVKNVILVADTIVILSMLFDKIKVIGWGMLIVKGSIIGLICTCVFMGAYARTEGVHVIFQKISSVLSKGTKNQRRVSRDT